MKFILPQKINSIISILQDAGFSAHLVGGCVRDMLTGRTPKDWDITTNALPKDVKKLFLKTYDTGVKHGTVTVSYEDSLVEVTTWRRETTYSDHRRPDQVAFTDSLIEDLSRRDFTMNAMAYNDQEGLIDPFSGRIDIEKRTIRCVGDPMKRFSEDALRMLRAVRFSAQLDFDIEDSTLRAIGSLYNDLTYVSMERVQAEINKLLESSSPHKLALLWQTGLSRVIFPQIPDYPEAWDQVGSYQVTVSGKKAVYLAALFYLSHNFDPTDVAVEALRRLKYDNQTMTTVALLIRGLRNHHAFSERNVRRIVTELGEKIAADVLNLTALLNNNSPAFGGNQSRFALKSNQSYPALENNQNSFHLENNHNRPALESNESPSLYSNLVQFNTRPALSGQDLQHSGLCYGKEIGLMLYMLSLCLYERPELNDKKTLLTLAQMMKQKYPLS